MEHVFVAVPCPAYVELPDGKVISGTEWGNFLLWDGGFIKVEIAKKGKKMCHHVRSLRIVCARALVCMYSSFVLHAIVQCSCVYVCECLAIRVYNVYDYVHAYVCTYVHVLITYTFCIVTLQA